MIRKLLLVGMLLIAGRGSVAQLFCAVVISFVSFSLQVKVLVCTSKVMLVVIPYFAANLRSLLDLKMPVPLLHLGLGLW